MGKSAENAVLALCRSYYGDSLGQKEYNDLVQCKTLADLRTYLRTKTHYSDCFEKLSTQTVTAFSIGQGIKNHQAKRFNCLIQYLVATQSKYFEYFITKSEVDEILRAVLLLLSGRTNQYYIQFDNYLNKHLRINLFQIGKADTLEELCEALRGTKYEKVFSKCLVNSDRSYIVFETVFHAFLNEELKKTIKKNFKGEEKQKVTELFARKLDLEFVSTQVRIKSNYETDNTLKAYVTPKIAGYNVPTLLSDSQRQEILLKKTEDEVLDVLKESKYKDAFFGDESLIENSLYASFCRFCRKNIRFSTYPSVVMFCYLFLCENELKNITHIAEGIKYNVPVSIIKNSLIGIENQGGFYGN